MSCLRNEVSMVDSIIVIILGVFVGFGISIYAMIKYNKGIF